MSDEHPSLLDGAIWPPENTKLFGHEDAEAFLAQSYRSGKGHHALLMDCLLYTSPSPRDS